MSIIRRKTLYSLVWLNFIMRISTIMSRMEDLLTKIQSGNIPKEDRDLLEVLILTGLVRKNNSTYEITEKGLEFLDKPVMEN